MDFFLSDLFGMFFFLVYFGVFLGFAIGNFSKGNNDVAGHQLLLALMSVAMLTRILMTYKPYYSYSYGW